MSAIYAPDGTIPQATNPYTPESIASSTNATPIVVTTSAPHGFQDGDTVEIEGHTINTNANGFWKITFISTTKFSLNGSVGNGVGGATGYAIDYSVNPNFTLPADLVDLMDVSSINPAIEGAVNPIPYFFKRVGNYRVYDLQRITLGTRGTTLSTTLTSTTAGAFGGLGSLTDLIPAPPASRFLKPIDHLLIRFQSSIIVSGGADASVALGVRINGGSLIFIPESSLYVGQLGAGHIFPFSLEYDYFNPFLTSDSTYEISVGACTENNGTGASVQITGCAALEVTHLRSNV